MNVKKPAVIAGAMAAIGVTSLVGLGVAGAASSGSDDNLAAKIAKKFNLKQSEVQAVFDQEHTEREAQMQARIGERLQELVDDGKITAEQKTLIEAKQKELHSAMEKERNELKAWAKKNNIEMRYLMFGSPRGGSNSDRLQALVDNGKITAEQKKLIEDKQAELKSKRDAAKDALDEWASQKDIDAKYLMGFAGRGHGGPGGPNGFKGEMHVVN